jgi:hypothetical protein
MWGMNPDDRILQAIARQNYIVIDSYADHTCDGELLAPEGECEACDACRRRPCHWCAFGSIFHRHDAESHYEYGDGNVSDEEGNPTEMPEHWHTNRHLYLPMR